LEGEISELQLICVIVMRQTCADRGNGES
jgi:hypothetical protein